MFHEGSKTHELLEYYFTDKPKFEQKMEEAIPPVKDYWSSVTKVLETELIKVKKIEHSFIHPRLPYCGIADCVGHIDGFGWCVLDWKTSQKRKKVTKIILKFQCLKTCLTNV